MKTLLRRLLPVLGLLLSGTLAARDLAISPLRLDLPAGKAMSVLTVANQGSETLLLQAGVKRWRQDRSGDSYDDDAAMLITPALFRLPPGQRQLVRIGWRRQAQPGDEEKAYRVFIEEVPTTGGSVNGLRVAMRLVVPLFVAARQPSAAKLDWQWRPAGSDHPAQLLATNHGHRHARITRIQLDGTRQDTLLYVLPGAQQVISLPAITPSATSRLSITDAEGTRSYPLSPAAP